MIQKEDDEGKVGVKIGKELMKVAGMALKVNITRLGPKVLPISEQLIFAGNFVARKVRPLLLYLPCCISHRPSWQWAVQMLSTVPTVNKVLLGSGESTMGLGVCQPLLRMSADVPCLWQETLVIT